MMFEFLGILVVVVIVADFIVGCVHHAEDSYCSDDTKFGNFMQKIIGHHVCDPNIDHHVSPDLMTKSNFFNRVFISCLFAGAFSLITIFTPFNFWWLHAVYWLSAMGNEVHNMNHKRDAELTNFERFLKDTGIVQQKSAHMIHHKKPYMTNYCVMINLNNCWMERINFWRKLERFVSLFGIDPKRQNRRDSLTQKDNR